MTAPRRVLRAVLIALLAGGVLVLTPGTSWACSCVSSTPAQQAKRAETVVDGTLRWDSDNGIETTYGIQVSKVYKGKAAEQEKLVGPTSSAACGLGLLSTNKRYLFFVQGIHPGQMKVSSCGGTVLYDPGVASQVQSVTGEPTGPLVSVPQSGPVDQDPIDGTPWWVVVLTGLAVAGVLAGLLLYAKRPRR